MDHGLPYDGGTEVRYNDGMKTTADARQTGEQPGDVPRPKLDPADTLTLIPRLLAGFFMGGMAVMYAFIHQWTIFTYLSIASAALLFWAYRLILKMRDQNQEYIAYRAAQEAETRRDKAAAR
jgi:hypothetical protein